MKQNLLKLKALLVVLMMAVGFGQAWAEDVTYTVSSTSSVTVTGTAPEGATATYSSTYNTVKQLTAGNSMTLTLSGYAGQKITAIKLSMKSNKSSGAGYLSVTAGTTTLATIGSSNSGVAFNNSAWNGAYTTSYVDVTLTMSNDSYTISDNEDVTFVIGATANSLYCESYTITYEAGEGGGDTKTLESIAVKDAPATTTYNEGATFDPAGLVITASYSDETNEDVAYEGNENLFTFNPTLTTPLTNENEVEIIYGGKSTTQGIIVNAFVPTEGTYDVVPNNALWGTSYSGSITGLSENSLDLNATSKGITFNLKNGSSTNGYVTNVQTRVYNGYKLTVAAPTGFVLSNIAFTADGNNWSGTPSVSAGEMTDNKTWEGSANSVIFTFNGTCRIASMAITYAKDKVLQALAVSGTPTKTTYEAGEALNPAGLVVTATYDDESQTEITDGITWSFDPETLTAGLTSCNVTATVGNVTSAAYEVSGLTVTVPKVLTGITVTGTPAEFWKGDTFNHVGMTVTANYDDETSADVTDEAEFSTPDMSVAGEQTVTVTYKEQIDSYTIDVKTIANTEETAYTTAEAIALIDAGKDLTSEVYVKGVVSSVDNFNDKYSSITYWLDNNAFEVYSGKGIAGADFESIDDIEVGAQVVVKGVIKLYGTTYEFDKNNVLVSYQAPVAATVEMPNIVVAKNPFLFSTTATITCATEGAAIKYSYDGETWNDYKEPLVITEAKTIYAKAIKDENESSVAQVTATKNLATPIVTVNGDITLDLDGETDVEAGTLSATVTYNNAAVDGATVTWTSNNTDVAEINETSGVVIIKTRGTVTFTATYAGNTDYAETSGTKTVTVTDSKAPGSASNPYTVAEIEAQADATTFGNDIYVTGYIVGSIYNNKCYKTTTTNLVNTNLLLADEPNISFTEGASIKSNTDGLIPIELPNNGTIRSDWGIDTNNYLIGYKIILKGNAQSYFSTKGIKGTSEITAVSAPAVVSTSSYATFAANADLDFTDSNIKAYIAKAKNDGSGVTFERKYKIPAGTGVLLYKDGGATEYIPVTTESTEDVTNNVFVRGEGVAVASEDGNKHNYILNIVNNVVGFYKAAGQKVAKNRAYIQVKSASFAKDFISMPGFDDSTTGVTEVNGSGLMVNGPVYDLQGRRVEKPGKGLYIVNGKKVLKY